MEEKSRLQHKKILITGGTGFIGSHLARLLSPTNEVWVAGRSGEQPNSAVQFFKGDIREQVFFEFVRNENFDVIFHLAGNANQAKSLEDPRYDLEHNLLATFNLLEVLRQLQKPPRLINASSVTVYGDNDDAVLNEDTSVLLPIVNYGASKLAAERYLYAYARQYGLPAITLRLFSTYGPGLRRQMVYDFIRKLSVNQDRLEIIGTGNEARDLTFIVDQVSNIVRVAEQADFKGEAYNLASGSLYSTRQVAESVARALGLTPEFIYTEKARVFDAPSWLADVNKIKKFGASTPTKLDHGVEQTVRWFKNVGS